MEALPFKEDLYEFIALCLCLMACFVDVMMNQLDLKRGKESNYNRQLLRILEADFRKNNHPEN
jgi:hypothetical protein